MSLPHWSDRTSTWGDGTHSLSSLQTSQSSLPAGHRCCSFQTLTLAVLSEMMPVSSDSRECTGKPLQWQRWPQCCTACLRCSQGYKGIIVVMLNLVTCDRRRVPRARWAAGCCLCTCPSSLTHISRTWCSPAAMRQWLSAQHLAPLATPLRHAIEKTLHFPACSEGCSTSV